MTPRHRQTFLARIHRWLREQREAPPDLSWISEERIEAHGDAGGEIKKTSRAYPKRIPRPRPGGDPDQPAGGAG